jgi:hypothetical protein
MTEGDVPPVDRGHFIWSHFPKREDPGVPSNQRHIALCLRRFRHRSEGYLLVAVYTTTRPRGERPKMKGEIEISADRAAEFGQHSAFRRRGMSRSVHFPSNYARVQFGEKMH